MAALQAGMRLRPHHRIYISMLLFGITTGSLLSRLPDLQEALGLSEGGLGFTLVAWAIGALIGLTVGPPLVARAGARAACFIGNFGMAALLSLVPLMPTAPLVAAVFVGTGLLTGFLEINLNTETDRHEAALGRRIMNRMHGMWSGGFFLAALSAAGIRQLGIPPTWHMAGVLVLVLVVATPVLLPLRNAPPRGGQSLVVAPRIALPTLTLLPICVVGAVPLLIEGAGIDWSAIYMRDVFDVVPFVGGLSITLFTLAMTVGRLTMDGIADRFGPRPVTLVLLLVSATGLLAVAFAPHPYVALFGFTLMGIGCSAIYPFAISAAAQLTDRPTAVNVAALSQMTFFVFFLGPPLLGLVAEYLGIRGAYVVCLAPVLGSILMIPALAPRTTAQHELAEPATPHG